MKVLQSQRKKKLKVLSSGHIIGDGHQSFMYLVVGYLNTNKEIPDIEFTIADLTPDKTIEKQIKNE